MVAYRLHRLANTLVTWPWLMTVAGGGALLVSLAHVPTACDAVNYFDPPKRLLWSMIALVLAGWGLVRTNRIDRTALMLASAYVAWVTARTLFKPNPAAELEVLFTWLLPVLLFMVSGSLDRQRGIRVLGACLAGSSLIQAILMVLQYVGLDPCFPDTTSLMPYRPGRMIGTIGYQNQAVDVLALAAVGLVLVSRSWILRGAGLAATLVVAGLTANRSGIIALVVASLLSGWVLISMQAGWSCHRRRQAAGMAVLAVGLALALIALIPQTGRRFNELVTSFPQSPAVGSRILLARVGIQMWEERPWVGWGAGEYAYQYLDRLGGVLPVAKTHELLVNIVFARETHNDYLQFAAEFGLVGAVLAAALFVSVAVPAWRRRFLDPDAATGMAFVISYMTVSACFSFPWQTSTGGPLAGLLLGALWPASNAPSQAKLPGPAGLATIWLPVIFKTMLVLVALITAGWFAIDAVLNRAVPHILAAGEPAAVRQFLPPFAYRYHALVGACYAGRNAYHEAEQELWRAQQGYRDLLLWNNLGHARARLNKWREARTIYEQWARSGLDHAHALRNLSIAQEQTGQLREAANTLSRYIALWPDPSPEDVRRLAVLQLQSGDPRKALQTLQTYRRLWMTADAATVAEIENLCGGVHLVLGDKTEARQCFLQALGRKPALESARRNLESLGRQ